VNGIWIVDFGEFPYPAVGGLGSAFDRTAASCSAWVPFDGSDPITARVEATKNLIFSVTSAFSSGDDLIQTTARANTRNAAQAPKAQMQSVTPGEKPRVLVKKDAVHSTQGAEGEAWALTSRYNPRTVSSVQNVLRVDLESGKTSPVRLRGFYPGRLYGGDGHVAIYGQTRTAVALLALDSATGETQGTLGVAYEFGVPFLIRPAGDSVLMQPDDSGTMPTGLYRAPIEKKMQLEPVEECDCWFAPLGRVPGGIWFARVPRDLNLLETPGAVTATMVRHDSATGTLGEDLAQDPLAPVLGGAAPGPGTEPVAPPAGATFTSAAFAGGGDIPARHTCEGEGVSPELAWSGGEDGVQEYAVVVVDPDAGGFVHWVVTGIPAGSSGLPEGAGDPAGTFAWTQGPNGDGGTGWVGPCPTERHQYLFTLYRSPAPLGLDGTATPESIRAAVAAAGGSAQELTGFFGG
jgi:Raf kinase inhibitor-like YbhB/YbcL family protein